MGEGGRFEIVRDALKLKCDAVSRDVESVVSACKLIFAVTRRAKLGAYFEAVSGGAEPCLLVHLQSFNHANSRSPLRLPALALFGLSLEQPKPDKMSVSAAVMQFHNSSTFSSFLRATITR